MILLLFLLQQGGKHKQTINLNRKHQENIMAQSKAKSKTKRWSEPIIIEWQSTQNCFSFQAWWQNANVT